MAATKTLCLYFFLLAVLLHATIVCVAQPIELDPKKWANELSKLDYEADRRLRQLDSMLIFVDSTKAFQFLNELGDKEKSKNYYFKATYNWLRASQLDFRTAYQLKGPFKKSGVKEEVKKLLAEAMDLAYRTEDDHFVAFISTGYAHVICNFGEIGLSVMYAMKGIDMYEKLSCKIPPMDYQFLAEWLYRVREYGNCIKYGSKAVEA